MISLRRKSIATIVVIILVVIAIVVLNVVGLVSYKLYSNIKWANLREHNKILVEQSASGLALPLWNFDRAVMKHHEESIMQDRSVFAVVIRGTDSTKIIEGLIRIADEKFIETNSEPATSGLLIETRRIYSSGGDIGSVRIFFSPKFLEKDLQTTRIEFIIAILVIAGILTFSLYLLLWLVVLKPLKILEKHAREISSGNPDSFAASTQSFPGELEDLRTSISSMVTQLETRNTELQNEMKISRESEQKYRLVTDNATEGILIAQDNLLKFVNPKVLQVLDRSLEEVLNHPFSDFVHPDDIALVRERHALRISGEPAPIQYDFRLIPKKGEVLWIQITSTAVEWEGKPAVLAFISDITERVIAEDALRESEERFRFLSTAASEGIIITEDGSIAEANEAAARILGYSDASQIIGKNPREIVTFPEPVNQEILDKVKNRTNATIETDCTRRDGSALVLEIMINEIVYKSESARLIILHDVTDKKRIDEALKLTRFSIEHVSDALFWMTPDARIVDVNEAACRSLGYTREELLQLIIPDIDPHYNATKWAQHFEDLRLHGTVKLETEHIAKDGRIFPIEVVANHLQYGNEERNCAFVRDITNRKQAELALKESEAKYRLLFESMTSTFSYNEIICDETGKPVDFRFVEVNDTFAQMYGHTTESIIGKLASEISKIPDPAWIECCGQVALTGVPSFIERYSPSIDRTMEFTLYCPKPGYFAAVGNDITLRKRTEEALRLSAAQLLANLENTPNVAVQWYDESGLVLYWNHASATLYGWKPEEAVGKTLDKLILTPKETGDFLQTLSEIARTGKSYGPCETVFQRRDGTIGWVLTTAFSIPMKDEQIGFVRMDIDITDRKIAENSLRESEERLRTLSTLAMEGVLIHRGFVILEANEAAAKLGRYPDSSYLIGKNILDIITFSDESKRRILSQLGKPSSDVYEAEFTRQDGTVCFIELTGQDIVYKGENARLSFIRNITERKHSEKAREKLQDQLQQAQKMESIGQLAGGVAHDFNNLLGVIIGHTELAMKHVKSDPKLFAHLEETQKAAARSANLTRQLLTFARKQTIKPKVLILNDAVVGMLKMLRRLIGEDINLIWSPGESDWSVRMDPSQIDQILANLCVNARDAIAGVGKVTIETHEVNIDEAYHKFYPEVVPGDYVQLVVSDSGCGMDKETLGKIFEPFFTTKEVGKGTGLGLATVYGIIKQNNGFINVYSEPGQGSIFKIYLPRHVTNHEQTHIESSTAPIASGNETILIVEDEPAILNMTTQMLEEYGYRVLATLSPGEAIKIANENSNAIHLLITDVVMPEMNGRKLSKIISTNYPQLKILFMSGYTSDIIAQHGVLEEGVNFIQKPFSTRDLVSKVREVLDNE